MDSNIDPSIAELDLFHVSSSLDRNNKDHAEMVGDGVGRVEEDHVSIPNVFRLNEYVAEENHVHHNGQHHDDESSTTAAALNMIQFNNFEDSHVEETNNGREGHSSHDTPGHFSHFSEDQLLQTHPYEADEPKTSFAVKVVPYNPSEKTKRLGRPRKNMSNTLAIPENSSSQNFNEAIVSKFRLDRLPLEGPGSRGGKLGARRSPRGRVTSGSIRKRKQQALLKNMTSVDENGNKTSKVSLLTNIPKDPPEDKQKDIENDNQTVTVASQDSIEDTDKISPKKGTSKLETPRKSDVTAIENPPNITAMLTKPSHDEKKVDQELPKALNSSQTRSKINTKKNTASIKKTRPFRGSSRVTSVSRTTVHNNRHRTTRQLPGPLIGLYYDLYDDNILEAQQNMEATSEKLALGFPILKSPYASDILYIISYLNKFKAILFGDKSENIGPQDIESGLSLPHIRADEMINSHFNSKSQEVPSDYDPTYISPTIDKLFCRLLTLVLNRKKEVNPLSPSKAISEIGSMSLYLGLPKEWRDDSNILKKLRTSDSQDIEPVDQKNQEILSSDNYTYELPSANTSPFSSPSKFESLGLKGIQDPKDRLIMMRTLMQWSLVTSDVVKNYITQSLQNQDISGEKETSYVARSILKGFKNTEEVKREAENKLNKKNSSILNESRESPENDNTAKYVDPTSDPLSHSMRLRLDELFIGDIGFNIGRFYLCRMADADNGGLASMRKMDFTWRNINEITTTLPSKFKLYVQDVHQMLTETLTKFGVEFDENEIEIESPSQDETGNWYEVASNAAEMTEFVQFLAYKLDLDNSPEPIARISKTSMIYKPILNLYNFLSKALPLIINQEKLQTESRPSRHKAVDYRYDTTANLDQYEEDDEDIVIENVDIEKGDDADYEEDGNDDYLD